MRRGLSTEVSEQPGTTKAARMALQSYRWKELPSRSDAREKTIRLTEKGEERLSYFAGEG